MSKHPYLDVDVQESSSSAFGSASATIINQNSRLFINTYSMTKYNWETADSIDAASYYAATEVALKMVSKEGLYQYFGEKMVGNETTCQ